MKQTIKDFEVMAPVGSRDSLAAAIKAGADAYVTDYVSKVREGLSAL